MKKLFAVLSMIAIMLTSLTNSTFASEPEEGIHADNFFKLKTHLLDSDIMVDIMVFAYDADANQWVETKRKHHRRNHVTILNPLFNYQIWFVDESGNTKVLFIDKGEAGPWMKTIDIDFGDDVYHAKLKQNIKSYDYELSAVSSDYDTLMVNGALEDIKTYKTKVCSAVMMR